MVEALQPDAPAAAPKVQAVIAGRLARLSRPAAELTGVAAAIGRAFTVDLLAAATELEEQAFIGALDELWRRGIVRAHGPNAYDFSHGRIRDAAYAALGPPRRRHVHLAVARALERSEHAGATAEAVRWHERAAEAAQWLHAHADAVRALERALALSGELPDGPDTAGLQLRLLTALPGRPGDRAAGQPARVSAAVQPLAVLDRDLAQRRQRRRLLPPGRRIPPPPGRTAARPGPGRTAGPPACGPVRWPRPPRRPGAPPP